MVVLSVKMRDGTMQRFNLKSDDQWQFSPETKFVNIAIPDTTGTKIECAIYIAIDLIAQIEVVQH